VKTRQPARVETKSKMNTNGLGMIETAKDKGVTVIKGTGNFVETTMNAAAQIVSNTAKDITRAGLKEPETAASRN
jgi:hypothetical protein